MTRVLGILSAKGGVGKTTLASNLAYVLTELGQNITVIDANITTPHLGLHLGIHLAPKTLHDILKGKTKIKDATYSHPFGFKVIPASMNVNDLVDVDVGKLPEVTLNLLGSNDFIILDCAPSLSREAITAVNAVDEILVITNPDLPSVADALRTIKIAEDLEKKVLGVVVNRIKEKTYELSREEIQEMTGTKVIAEIPEDKNVSKSIVAKNPIVDFDPYSPASIEIRRLAHSLVGKTYGYQLPSPGIFSRLLNWLTK